MSRRGAQLPGAALARLRDVLSHEPDVVRAVWKAGDRPQLLLALENVDVPIEEYTSRVQELVAATLPVLGSYGVAFACGPEEQVRGGIVVYEREPA